MCREKVAPDVISFSSAITSCEKGGNWQYALALFEAMRKRDLVTLSGTF
jgi:pentatricopeptide repeat protein